MEAQDKDLIKIDAIIHAPVAEVWRAWTEPNLVLQWFGSDPHGKGLKAEMDVRPSGTFEISFQNSDQTQHTCYGVYTGVYPLKKLSFTWNWKSEPGVESLVTVQLIAENNFALMQFEHANVGTASRHNYLEGWKATFVKLERVLNRQTNT
jgi:uncharacterized protein YndB with AHSA1/START domain